MFNTTKQQLEQSDKGTKNKIHHKWSKNTKLIVGDSIVSGIEENRILCQLRKVIVKSFPGATIGDMYDYIKLVFKNDSLNDIRNYRPVSILSNISKIFERLLYKQLETYFQSISSQYQCEFRKGFSELTTPLPVIEKWRESPDSGGNFEALLTDLNVYLMTYLLLSFMHTD